MASASAFQAEDEGSIPFTYSTIMEFWQTWCMHQIEDLANFVRIGEIPRNK